MEAGILCVTLCNLAIIWLDTGYAKNASEYFLQYKYAQALDVLDNAGHEHDQGKEEVGHPGYIRRPCQHRCSHACMRDLCSQELQPELTDHHALPLEETL